MIEKKEKKVLTEEEKEKFRKRGRNSRARGFNFEREVAKKLRELGYPNARTTREASRLLDSCKVDIFGIKVNLQLKNVKTKVKYLPLIELINEQLAKIYPSRLSYPTVVLHKQERKTLAIMTVEDFYAILGNKNLVEEWKE